MLSISELLLQVTLQNSWDRKGPVVHCPPEAELVGVFV
jgi:hypothetical protein